MSSSSRDKSSGGKKKKKDLWKEAGGEFYQENYPGGSGQATSTVDLTAQGTTQQRRVPRSHIPLPSQTARRNSLNPTGRNRFFTRTKQSYNTTTINGNNCMTYTSTMGGINDANEVHVALMPDLADETIPNEKTTYEALVKIKALPEPMHQKRIRKAKISGIPQLRLTGWKRFKWEFKKTWKTFKRSLQQENRNLVLFQNSLQLIEVRCGTSIVNVFLFVKWTILLNFIISIFIICCIVFPYSTVVEKEILTQRCNHSSINYNETKESAAELIQFITNSNYSHSLTQRIECCTMAYELDRNYSSRGSLTVVSRIIMRTNTTTIETTPLFYGYYMHSHSETSGYDIFSVAYVLVIAAILFVSLLLMVRNVGQGIQEIIMATEGEHHQYTNLVFAGWDNYTRDDAGASFKRKILRHEMKVALLSEKHNLESLIRNRKARIKLNFIRVLINLFVVGLLLVAGYIIFKVSDVSLTRNSTEKAYVDVQVAEHLENIAFSFAPSFIISFFNLIFPAILTKVGKLEKYSQQTETAIVLMRALFIRLMSVGFAAYSFYIRSLCEPVEEGTCSKCKFKGLHDQRRLCWESLFADQIYKLLITDLTLKCTLTFIVDPLRLALKKCFKNKICQRIGTMQFNIVRHSLDMIYLQSLSWMGMYFGPLIPIVSVFYCLVVFYIKRFSVLHNCTAIPDTFKTMKTTTIFVAAKLMGFIAVTFTNVAVIGYITPSRGCGPFREYNRPWEAVRNIIKLSKYAEVPYNYIASPGITTPLTMILTLLAYYYYAVAQANRGMVETLRHLLILEGHDKQYLFARLNSLRRKSPTSTTRSEDSRFER